MSFKAGDIFVVKYRTKTPTSGHTGAESTAQSNTLGSKDCWAMYLISKVGSPALCRITLLAEQKPKTSVDFMKVSQYMSDGVDGTAPGAMPMGVGSTATEGISLSKLNDFLKEYTLVKAPDKAPSRPRFAYAFPIMSCANFSKSVVAAMGGTSA